MITCTLYVYLQIKVPRSILTRGSRSCLIVLQLCSIFLVICIFKLLYVQVWVRWIGHSTVSLVEVSAVKPLKEGIKHRTRYGKKLPKKLQDSVDQALKLLKKRQIKVMFTSEITSF